MFKQLIVAAGIAAVAIATAAGEADNGPNTCVNGYVWREAVPGDHVCVTPATRQQVHDDNLTGG